MQPVRVKTQSTTGASRRRTWWSWCWRGQVLVIVTLALVMGQRVGHAAVPGAHLGQALSHAEPVTGIFFSDQARPGEKFFGVLSDDDDDDDDGDDCPTPS
jgi:hypothetical protein